jgi:curli biogenesis system outer membrane secretion channel CsgG
MSMRFSQVLFLAVVVLLTGCATVEKKPANVEAPVSQMEQRSAQTETLIPVEKSLKHKVAIGRFTNETRYGKALLGGDVDPLGRQTSDMLATRLQESGKFIVLERPDIGLVQGEQLGNQDAALVGVDALIIGSLTEFGRNVTGKKGFASGTKHQAAYAKVEVRLVDARTGHVFHSATGAGKATIESGAVLGFGSRASYDATLNDKAIGAAISDLMSDIVSKVSDRPWRTDVLKVDGNRVYMSGGPSQGMKIGDEFVVKRSGDTVTSQQTGFLIELPGTEVARLRVDEFFGETEVTEGAVAVVIGGDLSGLDRSVLHVSEP